MEAKAQEIIARIRSEKSPLPGQRHRSSGNLSSIIVPEGTKRLKWVIVGGEELDLISFDVKEDGTDLTHFQDVLNEGVTPVVPKKDLYIANPKGASRAFQVEVYAIF